MKSYIPPDRLQQLKKPGAIYTISCHEKEYSCLDHKDNRCWRGFFSLFLQVAYGIQFAKKLDIPYQVDFANLTHSYTDQQRHPNFWDAYFDMPEMAGTHKVLNIPSENYPLKIWDKGYFRKLHTEAITEIKLKPGLKEFISDFKKQWEGQNVLGIHIRKTDHYREIPPAGDETYFKLVKKHINRFDKLFIATDDRGILEEFKKRYPLKAVSHDFLRSEGNQALHLDQQIESPYELGRQAVLDCYTLAACSSLILSPSNLSYAALLINPDMPYQLAESPQAGQQRRKTLMLYHLDKWGFRKW